ncbi:hypothetical protein EV1_026276 [Malus domestica]
MISLLSPSPALFPSQLSLKPSSNPATNPSFFSPSFLVPCARHQCQHHRPEFALHLLELAYQIVRRASPSRQDAKRVEEDAKLVPVSILGVGELNGEVVEEEEGFLQRVSRVERRCTIYG